jgi:glycerol-3-phosphate acyltransferase PlsX
VTDRPITVAVDAMGGDNAPGEIVAGALDTAAELGLRVELYGRIEAILEHVPGGVAPEGVEIIDCREVVAMDDGRAAALRRMGRIPGIARPAIAVPVPVPGYHPQVLIDAGATVDAAPEWLVQFARMGREYARARWHIEQPSIGLLSNGEEEGKGDELRKTVFDLLRKEPGFVGNVEASDFMRPGHADVIVTDGFTGNVALKALESALRSLAGLVFNTLESTEEARAASAVILPLLLEAAEAYDPDLTGGAVLLGVKGMCVISHGSSTARAIVSAARVARECVRADVVGRLRETVADAR